MVGSDVEDKITAIWAAVHRSDSFPSVRELLNSIVISVKKRAVSEINKISFQQSTLRRRYFRILSLILQLTWQSNETRWLGRNKY